MALVEVDMVAMEVLVMFTLLMAVVQAVAAMAVMVHHTVAAVAMGCLITVLVVMDIQVVTGNQASASSATHYTHRR